MAVRVFLTIFNASTMILHVYAWQRFTYTVRYFLLAAYFIVLFTKAAFVCLYRAIECIVGLPSKVKTLLLPKYCLTVRLIRENYVYT